MQIFSYTEYPSCKLDEDIIVGTAIPAKKISALRAIVRLQGEYCRTKLDNQYWCEALVDGIWIRVTDINCYNEKTGCWCREDGAYYAAHSLLTETCEQIWGKINDL